MPANSRFQSLETRAQVSGGVWYKLRSEREMICEALLTQAKRFDEGREKSTGDSLVPDDILETGLQNRLRLLDEAMDRLMTGSYGDCVKCGRWIEDSKLHQDPAFPFCVACEHNQLWPLHFKAHVDLPSRQYVDLTPTPS